MEDNNNPSSMALVPIENDTVSHLNALIREMGLIDVAQSIDATGVPEELSNSLQQLVSVIGDMLSLSRPTLVDDDPVKTLVRASNELKISHLIRERGYMRLWLVLSHRDEESLPPWEGMVSEFNGNAIVTQTDFLFWFNQKTGVSKATTFNRMATYKRLLSIGMNLDEIFERTALMPEAIRKGMNFVASWDTDGEIIGIPERGINVMRRYASEQDQEAFQKAMDDDDLDAAKALYRPAVRELIDDFTELKSAKEALTFLKSDVLLKPEISYRWDEDKLCIVITYIQRDSEGTEVDYAEVDLVIEDIDAPVGVWKDVIERLPVAKKQFIELPLD